VKYAYQELPHSEDTASPHSQKEKDREKENMINKTTSPKTDTTNN
jgi:hypothetical protein